MTEYKGALGLLNAEPEEVEEKKKRTTLYIDKKIYERFQKLCDQRGKSVSEVIEAAMKDLLAGVRK